MRRRTISLRLRLTLSYGGVFFALGFLLIAVSYVLVHQVLVHNPGEFLSRVAAHLDLPQGFPGQGVEQPALAAGGGERKGLVRLVLRHRRAVVLDDHLKAPAAKERHASRY